MFVFVTLCISDMKGIIDVKECTEYADISTIYHSCKTKELCKCANDIRKQIKLRYDQEIFLQNKSI